MLEVLLTNNAMWSFSYKVRHYTNGLSTPKAAWGHQRRVLPGARLELARPQWPGDFKSPT